MSEAPNEQRKPMDKKTLRQFLLLYEVKEDVECSLKDIPLQYAVNRADDRMFEFLLDHGADLEGKGSYEATPLQAASIFGDVGVVRLLLEHGADIEGRNAEESTPLHLACAHGHEGVVKLLLDWSANIEARNHIDNTPLYTAIRWREAGTVRLLLERGASPLAVATRDLRRRQLKYLQGQDWKNSEMTDFVKRLEKNLEEKTVKQTISKSAWVTSDGEQMVYNPSQIDRRAESISAAD